MTRPEAGSTRRRESSLSRDYDGDGTEEYTEYWFNDSHGPLPGEIPETFRCL
jgi:hypothetical protein